MNKNLDKTLITKGKKNLNKNKFYQQQPCDIDKKNDWRIYMYIISRVVLYQRRSGTR